MFIHGVLCSINRFNSYPYFCHAKMDFTHIGLDDLVASLRVDELIEMTLLGVLDGMPRNWPLGKELF